MRDLVRVRAAAVEAPRVHRQRVSAFMLKHGRTYPRKMGWTMRYLRWLQEQQFDHPAHQIAPQEMVEAVRVAWERVERRERMIEEFVSAWSLEPLVRALQTLRGIDLIVAVTFATEVGDVSRFERPRQLMVISVWCPASDRRESPSGVAASPRRATAASATCWSRAPRPIDTRRRSARQSYIGSSRHRQACERSRGKHRAA